MNHSAEASEPAKKRLSSEEIAALRRSAAWRRDEDYVKGLFSDGQSFPKAVARHRAWDAGYEAALTNLDAEMRSRVSDRAPTPDEIRRGQELEPLARVVLAERLAEAAEQRAARLEAALTKAVRVIENTTQLFHPNYLLHTDALIKECKAALAAADGTGEGA